MGCLFIMLAASAPRVALVLMWIFGDMVDRAFSGWLVPALGIVALPYTTLFFVFAWSPVGGVTGWGYLSVLLGALIDIANLAGAGVKARRRATAY